MKNYEEMTRNVLKRRDEALTDKAAKRCKALKTAVPCAAVLTVAAVGVGVWANNGSRGKYINPCIVTVSGEIGQLAPDIFLLTEVTDSEIDLTVPYTPKNPNRITVNTLESAKQSETVFPDESYFKPMTLEALGLTYGIRLDALSVVDPDWIMEQGKLGFYIEEKYDEQTASMRFLLTQNTVSFTNGGKCFSVTADQFDRLPQNAVSVSESEKGSIKKSLINDEDVEIFQIGDSYIAQFVHYNRGFCMEASGLSIDEFVEAVSCYIR